MGGGHARDARPQVSGLGEHLRGDRVEDLCAHAGSLHADGSPTRRGPRHAHAGHPDAAGRGLPRARRRRPDRRRRPQRRGQVHPAARARGQQEPDAGRVTRAGGVQVAVLDQRDQLAPGRTVLDVVHGSADEHEWAADSRIRSVHAGLLADVSLDTEVDSLSGGQRRRVALAALLVRDEEILRARRADQPPRRRGRRVAGRAPGRALRARAGRARRRHARPLVPRRRLHADLGGPRRRRRPVRGRLRGLRAGAGRARPQDASTTEEKRQNLLRKELAWLRRGAPARTSKPKFRLDAAAELIADEPPPRDQLSLTRMATARLGKDVLDIEDASGRSTATACCCTTSPGGSAPATASASSASTAPARRRCCGCCPVGSSRRTGRVKRGKTVQVAELRQDVEDLDELADLRVVEVIEQEKRSVVVGGKELTAAQLVERLGFTRERVTDARARPVRWRAAPAPAAAAARRRAQRAAARRAHQRPRHRHPRRPRGPARRLAGHPDRRLARPLPAGTRLRPADGPARRRRCCATCPAASSST